MTNGVYITCHAGTSECYERNCVHVHGCHSSRHTKRSYREMLINFHGTPTEPRGHCHVQSSTQRTASLHSSCNCSGQLSDPLREHDHRNVGKRKCGRRVTGPLKTNTNQTTHPHKFCECDSCGSAHVLLGRGSEADIAVDSMRQTRSSPSSGSVEFQRSVAAVGCRSHLPSIPGEVELRNCSVHTTSMASSRYSMEACKGSKEQIILYGWFLMKPLSDNFYTGSSTISGVSIGGYSCPRMADADFIQTAPVVQRLERWKLRTSDGVDVGLMGMINIEKSVANGFSPTLVPCFMIGFPSGWIYLILNLNSRSLKGLNLGIRSTPSSPSNSQGIEQGIKNCRTECTALPPGENPIHTILNSTLFRSPDECTKAPSAHKFFVLDPMRDGVSSDANSVPQGDCAQEQLRRLGDNQNTDLDTDLLLKNPVVHTYKPLVSRDCPSGECNGFRAEGAGEVTESSRRMQNQINSPVSGQCVEFEDTGEVPGSSTQTRNPKKSTDFGLSGADNAEVKDFGEVPGRASKVGIENDLRVKHFENLIGVKEVLDGMQVDAAEGGLVKDAGEVPGRYSQTQNPENSKDFSLSGANFVELQDVSGIPESLVNSGKDYANDDVHSEDLHGKQEVHTPLDAAECFRIEDGGKLPKCSRQIDDRIDSMELSLSGPEAVQVEEAGEVPGSSSQAPHSMKCGDFLFSETKSVRLEDGGDVSEIAGQKHELMNSNHCSISGLKGVEWNKPCNISENALKDGEVGDQGVVHSEYLCGRTEVPLEKQRIATEEATLLQDYIPCTPLQKTRKRLLSDTGLSVTEELFRVPVLGLLTTSQKPETQKRLRRSRSSLVGDEPIGDQFDKPVSDLHDIKTIQRPSDTHAPVAREPTMGPSLDDVHSFLISDCELGQSPNPAIEEVNLEIDEELPEEKEISTESEHLNTDVDNYHNQTAQFKTPVRKKQYKISKNYYQSKKRKSSEICSPLMARGKATTSSVIFDSPLEATKGVTAKSQGEEVREMPKGANKKLGKLNKAVDVNVVKCGGSPQAGQGDTKEVFSKRSRPAKKSILPPPLPSPRVADKSKVTEAFGLKRSLHGRVLVPPLATWRRQSIKYDMDGGIIGITDGFTFSEAESSTGFFNFEPPSDKGAKALQRKLCKAANKGSRKN